MSVFNKLKNSSARKRTSYRRPIALMVESYPDAETVEGYETLIGDDGTVMVVGDENGDPLKIRISLGETTSERRKSIAEFMCGEGEFRQFIQETQEKYDAFLKGVTKGIHPEDLKVFVKVKDGQMSLEGGIRNLNGQVEPGGIIAFDGCEERGPGVYVASWAKALRQHENELVVIPPKTALYTVYAPKVYDEAQNKTLRGSEAVMKLNEMTDRDAADAAVVDVDILFYQHAQIENADFGSAILKGMQFVSKMNAGRSGGVTLRFLDADNNPVKVASVSIGSEPTGVLDENDREVYDVRTPESALERHLAQKLYMGDSVEMTYAELYEEFREENGVLEVIPKISVTLSQSDKEAAIKEAAAAAPKGEAPMLPGDALLHYGSLVDVFPEVDEQGVPVQRQVGSMMGGTQVIDSMISTPLFGRLSYASLNTSGDYGKGLARVLSHPRRDHNFKAFRLAPVDSPNSYEVLKPIHVRDLAPAAAPEEPDLDDMPPLTPENARQGSFRAPSAKSSTSGQKVQF